MENDKEKDILTSGRTDKEDKEKSILTNEEFASLGENRKIHTQSADKPSPSWLSKPVHDLLFISLFIAFGLILIILTLQSVNHTQDLKSDFDAFVAGAVEASKPGNIKLVVIENKECAECFDISPIVESIKNTNLNIVKEEVLDISSDKAKEIIDKYGIERIPTVIISGELSKVRAVNFENKEKALVFTDLLPPYTDASSGEIIGFASAIVLEDSSCFDCSNMSQMIDLIEEEGIPFGSRKIVDISSDEGAKLIEKYDIKVVPTLIFSKDIGLYDSDLINNWESLGSIEDDGSYVSRISNPPYFNLTADEVQGLVSAVYLEDKSCDECYDPMEFHGLILKRLGLFFENELVVDITDSLGEDLIKKYEITKVPTVILTGHMNQYPSLAGVWDEIGSIEDDDAWVFRNLDAIRQVYKDLDSGEIV